MVQPARVVLATPDPIIAAFELHHAIDPDVLRLAIEYRESLIEQLFHEVEIIERTRQRLQGQREF